MKTSSFKYAIKALQIFIAITLVIGIAIVVHLLYTGRVYSFITAPALMKDNFEIKSGILVLPNLAFLIPLLIGINSLVKTIPYFEKQNYFAPVISKKFKLSSKAFIFSGIAALILQILSALIENSRVVVALGMKSLLYLFILVIGLFFGFLAKVFEKARVIEEENDLTI